MSQCIEGTDLAFSFFQDRCQFRIRRFVGENVFLQVPVQADTAVDDDVIGKKL